MNGLETFLIQYGLTAIFIIMLMKSIGVPIPIPADVLILATAVRTAEGKFVLWQAFLTILVAVVVGGIVQFALVRGPGRGVLYRFGRYIGLTQSRLDAAAEKVRKGGVVGLSVAILVPGVRSAAIAASGLADFSYATFVAGLVIGSTLFLGVHFFLGFLGNTVLAVISRALPSPTVITIVLLLLVAVYILWAVAVQRQKIARKELEGTILEVWHEGICPVCLALYTANQLRPLAVDVTA